MCYGTNTTVNMNHLFLLALGMIEVLGMCCYGLTVNCGSWGLMCSNSWLLGMERGVRTYTVLFPGCHALARKFVPHTARPCTESERPLLMSALQLNNWSLDWPLDLLPGGCCHGIWVGAVPAGPSWQLLPVPAGGTGPQAWLAGCHVGRCRHESNHPTGWLFHDGRLYWTRCVHTNMTVTHCCCN